MRMGYLICPEMGNLNIPVRNVLFQRGNFPVSTGAGRGMMSALPFSLSIL